MPRITSYNVCYTKLLRIIDEGNDVRVGNFKSQAKRDPKIFQEALGKFPRVYDLLDEIRTLTRDETDRIALDRVESAAKDYETAMQSSYNFV